MKTILKNYSFNTATKAITCTDVASVRLDRLLLITDVTTNKILYNFADSTVSTATVTANVITLSLLQGGESNTDKLDITYDTLIGDTAFGDSTDAVQVQSSVLPTGAATSANQTNASQKTQIVDGSGNVIGSSSNALNVAITSALPAGTNAIGHIITDSGSTTAVTQATASNLNATVVGTGTFAVQNTPVSSSTIFNGKTIVTTAGTGVTLASSTTVKSVTIKALATNTGTIYVGNSSVASTNGLQLAAGDSISMDITNLNTVNIDSSVNGEGVTYLGVN